VDKYLRAYAEPEAALCAEFEALRGTGLDAVLAVPIYAERDADVAALLDSVEAACGASHRLLVILVINSRSDSPPEIETRNAALLDFLTARHGPLQGQPPLWLSKECSFGRLLLVVRTAATRPLPADQGVGLARKVGADAALALIRCGSVRRPFIHFTDADAVLPTDYFERIAKSAEGPDIPAAWTYPFVHVSSDPAEAERAMAYECRIRSYVHGLSRAGSPYAFHSVGSTMAIAADAYAAVRGVPKRTAAEDFYLLNKVAKVGCVARLTGAPIVLQGRVSTRVPFGTGMSLQALAKTGLAAARVYDPGAFALLGQVIEAMERLAQRRGRTLSQALGDDNASLRLLDSLAITEAIDRAAARAGSTADRLHHMHIAFDGFRSLKLVNALRARGYPDITLAELARRLDLGAGGGDPSTLSRALAADGG